MEFFIIRRVKGNEIIEIRGGEEIVPDWVGLDRINLYVIFF
jgi:hypothetical protein